MGAPEGVGGGGELINLPSAKKFFIAAMLLWDEDDIGTIVFYSVIYNSVVINHRFSTFRLLFAVASQVFAVEQTNLII